MDADRVIAYAGAGEFAMRRRKRKSQWKWILLGSLVPLIAATAGLTAFLLWPREQITWENFERLRPGMSRAEAEALLGPAKHFFPHPMEKEGIAAVPWASRFRNGPVDNTTYIQPTHVWDGRILTILAVFDSDDTLDGYTADVHDDEAYKYVPEHVKRDMFRFVQQK
jgi:hypothetical protein